MPLKHLVWEQSPIPKPTASNSRTSIIKGCRLTLKVGTRVINLISKIVDF